MLIVYLFLVAYFSVQYFFTQKIYSGNKFGLLFIFAALLFCFIVFINISFKNKNLFIVLGAIPFFYLLLLFVIKKKYSHLNNFFIDKKWISRGNADKDFTYFLWTQDIYSSSYWWNEKLAKKPTLLDRCLTALIIVMPFVLSFLLFFIIK
jgi:hypothetical protein